MVTGNQQRRKEQVLTHGAPSMARSIADAVVLKDEGVFLVTDQGGMIPLLGGHGFGLYYHDCRFLNGYSIELGGAAPEVLGSTSEAGHEGVFQLTNTRLRMPDGRVLPKHEIGVRWERIIEGGALALYEKITLHNYSREAAHLEVKLAFHADFEDIFVVRDLLPAVRGDLRPPVWTDDELRLSYDGRDGIHRAVTIRWGRKPDAKFGEPCASFLVRVEPGGSEEISFVIALSESSEPVSLRSRVHTDVDIGAVERRSQERSASFRAGCAGIETDSELVNRVLARSLADLRLLWTPLDQDEFFAAGVPWFVALFGRDSLITALEVLAYDRRIAADTLRLLAKYQGSRDDAWREEQPGKILHELRVGELARLDEIPHTPYYGSVDATALFLILVARHAAWTGDLDLFHELRANVDAALGWLSTASGDPRIPGYIAYGSTSTSGLINRGWKDSGDAIVDEKGQLAVPPIALVEVQAYTYLAKTEIAALFERAGQPGTAARLRSEAAELRERFNRDFWMPARDFYALALTAGGRPAAVCASNPGHALWAGIIDPAKAAKTAGRLVSEAMYSGWGIRTLAADERGYNPIAYHRGTVWPHDNALIAAGFRRYGFDREARRVLGGIVTAALSFPMYRLPEVFTGFSRAEYGVPIRYPVACHPQAWAAGAVPFMLATLLGLEPDGFERRLRIVRPILPQLVRRAEVRGLTVADGRVDLEFRRKQGAAVEVDVLKIEGDIDVVIEKG